MAKIAYQAIAFRARTLDVIGQVNAICEEYAGQGFQLTLRQLFYQFVSRSLIANRDAEYLKLASIVNDGRIGGLIDWDHIVDRTRQVRLNGHWRSPVSIMLDAADGYEIDKWRTQPWQPEVWIEKDALLGVIEGVCRANDVPRFSCRGYTSQSEVWAGAQRIRRYRERGQTPIVLHLGDHDPSGLDMTRDIRDRLSLFLDGDECEVRRLALNIEQVQLYAPPPNPAKVQDARFVQYQAEFGDESWELDALQPSVIVRLIEDALSELREPALWQTAIDREQSHRSTLRQTARTLAAQQTLPAKGI